MDKLLLRPMEAAESLGVSRSRIYELIQSGELPGIVRLGRSVRVSSEALRVWVRKQAGGESGSAPAA
jgi:excisionase family DNA binding protein